MSDISYHGIEIGRIEFDRSVTVQGTLDGERFDVAIPGARLVLSDAIKALIDGQNIAPEPPTDPIPPKEPDQPPPEKEPEPPADPEPPKDKGPTPPVDPKPPVDLPPPPPPAHDDGPHTVTMTVVDKDHTWVATGHVGDDPTVGAVYVPFIEPSTGKLHPGLTAWFYADCCEAGATRIDNAYDFINFRSVTVQRDGVDVPVPPSSKPDGTYDFYRSGRCPAIRYGTQVGWSADKIDWTLLPSYPRDGSKQNPYNDAKHNFGFNGMGTGTTAAMGQGGSRPDLGYLPVWDLAFISDPRDATWAVARRAADHDGWWCPVFASDPATGSILRPADYPMTNFDTGAHSSSWAKNAYPVYGGAYDGDTLTKPKTGLSNISISPYAPNGLHLTAYALVAAMVTGTARDRDHASFWSAFPMFETGAPGYLKSSYVWDPQRRFAWCTRNLFMAAFVSSHPDFFAAELARELPTALAAATHPLGILDTQRAYPRDSVNKGGQVAVAPWMQYYLAIVLDPIQRKLPEWRPFAQFLGRMCVKLCEAGVPFLASIGSLDAVNTEADLKTQTQLTDMHDAAYRSLLRWMYTPDEATAITTGDVAAQVAALQAAAARGVLESGGKWAGKEVGGVIDCIGYPASVDNYATMAMAAFVCAANAGTPGFEQCLAYRAAVPTKADLSTNWIFNLVPREPQP